MMIHLNPNHPRVLFDRGHHSQSYGYARYSNEDARHLIQNILVRPEKIKNILKS